MRANRLDRARRLVHRDVRKEPVLLDDQTLGNPRQQQLLDQHVGPTEKRTGRGAVRSDPRAGALEEPRRPGGRRRGGRAARGAGADGEPAPFVVVVEPGEPALVLPPAPGFEAAAVGAQTLRRAAPGRAGDDDDRRFIRRFVRRFVRRRRGVPHFGSIRRRLRPRRVPVLLIPVPVVVVQGTRHLAPLDLRQPRRPHAVGDAKRHRHGVETGAVVGVERRRERRESQRKRRVHGDRPIALPRGRERIGVVHRRPVGWGSPPRARRREGAELPFERDERSLGRRDGGSRARRRRLRRQRDPPRRGGDGERGGDHRERPAARHQTAPLGEREQALGVLDDGREFGAPVYGFIALLAAFRPAAFRRLGRRRRRAARSVRPPRVVLVPTSHRVAQLRYGRRRARHERRRVERRHLELVQKFQPVVDATQREDVQLARLRDVPHGDGQRVLPARGVHARAREHRRPLSFPPPPVARLHHERLRIRGRVFPEPELAARKVDGLGDVLHVRRLLVPEELLGDVRADAARADREAAARGGELPAAVLVDVGAHGAGIFGPLDLGREASFVDDVAARRADVAPEVLLVLDLSSSSSSSRGGVGQVGVRRRVVGEGRRSPRKLRHPVGGKDWMRVGCGVSGSHLALPARGTLHVVRHGRAPTPTSRRWPPRDLEE